jgi:hypothetical protein
MNEFIFRITNFTMNCLRNVLIVTAVVAEEPEPRKGRRSVSGVRRLIVVTPESKAASAAAAAEPPKSTKDRVSPVLKLERTKLSAQNEAKVKATDSKSPVKASSDAVSGTGERNRRGRPRSVGCMKSPPPPPLVTPAAVKEKQQDMRLVT